MNGTRRCSSGRRMEHCAWRRARRCAEEVMHVTESADDGYREIRNAIRTLCATFPDEYFRRIDAEHGYPTEFVAALTKAGWLAALIPQEYGGAGLGLAEASVIMEEINRSGGNSGACHGQMYNMGT